MYLSVYALVKSLTPLYNTRKGPGIRCSRKPQALFFSTLLLLPFELSLWPLLPACLSLASVSKFSYIHMFYCVFGVKFSRIIQVPFSINSKNDLMPLLLLICSFLPAQVPLRRTGYSSICFILVFLYPFFMPAQEFI